MVNIPDELRCLFSMTLERHDDSYVLEIPREELDHGDVTSGETYRVAVLPQPGADSGVTAENRQERGRDATPETPNRTPPVEEGDIREVAIESLGKRGDGITKVERGYVVIVPKTRPGDEVTIEIEQVRDNVAFAHVIEDEDESTDATSEDATLDGLSAQPPPIDPDEQP